jgi:hypothetical protein
VIVPAAAAAAAAAAVAAVAAVCTLFDYSRVCISWHLNASAAAAACYVTNLTAPTIDK